MSQVVTMTKLHEYGFVLRLHPLYSPDLAPSDWLFPWLKMLQWEGFGPNDEVNAAIEAFFEEKDNLFSHIGVEMIGLIVSLLAETILYQDLA